MWLVDVNTFVCMTFMLLNFSGVPIMYFVLDRQSQELSLQWFVSAACDKKYNGRSFDILQCIFSYCHLEGGEGFRK